MDSIILWAIAAAFNPTLLGATTVMLLLDHPKRLLLGYLLGALMTSLTLGMVIVFTLDGSSGATSTGQSTPEWTPDAVDRFKAWFNRNSRVLGFRIALVIGTLLVVKGGVELL
jgi:hypothetical protein